MQSFFFSTDIKWLRLTNRKNSEMKLKKYLQSIQFQLKGKYIKTYIFLVVLRVCLVFLPQLGYIHPDEFFQSVEVPTGKINPTKGTYWFQN